MRNVCWPNIARVPASACLEWGFVMLARSRKSGERISIGGEIELTVLGIHKDRVKLAFSKPLEFQSIVMKSYDVLLGQHMQPPWQTKRSNP